MHGLWRFTDDGSVVALQACDGERLCGVLRGLPPSGHRDAGALAACGLSVLSDFAAAGPGHWTQGRVLDPETGKTYPGSLRRTGPDVLELIVGSGLLSSTLRLERHSGSVAGCPSS